MKDMYELDDQELAKVTGGRGGGIFNAKDISGADKEKHWEVIDAKGDVVARCSSRDEAIFQAGRNDLDYKEVNWNDVVKMRG